MSQKKMKKKYRHGIEKNVVKKVKKSDLLVRIEALEQCVSKLVDRAPLTLQQEFKPDA